MASSQALPCPCCSRLEPWWASGRLESGLLCGERSRPQQTRVVGRGWLFSCLAREQRDGKKKRWRQAVGATPIFLRDWDGLGDAWWLYGEMLGRGSHIAMQKRRAGAWQPIHPSRTRRALHEQQPVSPKHVQMTSTVVFFRRSDSALVQHALAARHMSAHPKTSFG